MWGTIRFEVDTCWMRWNYVGSHVVLAIQAFVDTTWNSGFFSNLDTSSRNWGQFHSAEGGLSSWTRYEGSSACPGGRQLRIRWAKPLSSDHQRLQAFSQALCHAQSCRVSWRHLVSFMAWWEQISLHGCECKAKRWHGQGACKVLASSANHSRAPSGRIWHGHQWPSALVIKAACKSRPSCSKTSRDW